MSITESELLRSGDVRKLYLPGQNGPPHESLRHQPPRNLGQLGTVAGRRTCACSRLLGQPLQHAFGQIAVCPNSFQTASAWSFREWSHPPTAI